MKQSFIYQVALLFIFFSFSFCNEVFAKSKKYNFPTFKIDTVPVVSLNYLTGNCANAASLSISGADSSIAITWYKNGQPIYSESTYKTLIKYNYTTAYGIVDMVLDKLGNIYVSEQGYNRVKKWVPGASTGTIVAGGNGAGSAANQINVPEGIFVDSNFNVYVSDNSNNRVQKWAPGATSGITVAGGNGYGTAANQFKYPSRLYVDRNQNLYVSDPSNSRIQKWAPGATSGITVAGGNGSGSAANQLNGVYGSMWVDSALNVFVADQSNHRIQKWMPGSTSGVTIAGGNGFGTAPNQLTYPSDLCFDKSGNLYVAVSEGVKKFAPNSTTGIYVAGTGSIYGGNAIGGSIALDSSNSLYTFANFLVDIVKWSFPIVFPNTVYNTTTGGTYEAVVTNRTVDSARTNSITTIPTIPTLLLSVNNNNYIMSGTNFIFTANTLNPGISPVFTFNVNGNVVQVGSSNVFSSTSLQENDIISCSLSNNNQPCPSPQIISNNIKLTAPTVVGVMTTLAGGGTDSTSTGISSILSKLKSPQGVFVDKNGNTYISDSRGHKVRKVSPNGIITTIAGTGVAGATGTGGLATAARINYPLGIYVDTIGNVYISCLYENRIRKVSASTGIISTFAGNGTYGNIGDGGLATSARIGSVQSITGDTTGNIYFTDFDFGSVRKVNAAGIITRVAGLGTGTMGYSGDGGLATAAELGAPNGVCFDGLGNMYISDDVPNCVRKVNPSGIISTVAGGSNSIGDSGDGGLATSALFGDIESMVADSIGNLYIVDAGNQKIRKVDTSGKINTIAGTGFQGFNRDSLFACAAHLNNPWAICKDKFNDLYVADMDNNLIRKITLPVTTLHSGNWSDVSVWSKRKIPDAATIITNDKSVTLDINAFCWSLILRGVTINLNPGSSLYISEH